MSQVREQVCRARWPLAQDFFYLLWRTELRGGGSEIEFNCEKPLLGDDSNDGRRRTKNRLGPRSVFQTLRRTACSRPLPQTGVIAKWHLRAAGADPKHYDGHIWDHNMLHYTQRIVTKQTGPFPQGRMKRKRKTDFSAFRGPGALTQTHVPGVFLKCESVRQ